MNDTIRQAYDDYKAACKLEYRPRTHHTTYVNNMRIYNEARYKLCVLLVREYEDGRLVNDQINNIKRIMDSIEYPPEMSKPITYMNYHSEMTKMTRLFHDALIYEYENRISECKAG